MCNCWVKSGQTPRLLVRVSTRWSFLRACQYISISCLAKQDSVIFSFPIWLFRFSNEKYWIFLEEFMATFLSSRVLSQSVSCFYNDLRGWQIITRRSESLTKYIYVLHWLHWLQPCVGLGIWAQLYIETDVQLRVFILPGRERGMTSPGICLELGPDHLEFHSFIIRFLFTILILSQSLWMKILLMKKP